LDYFGFGFGSTTLDHRACQLSFTNTLKSANNTQIINSRILNNDIVDLIIFASCAEAYAIHATDAVPVPLKREQLLRIASLKQEIKSIGPPVLPCSEIEFDTGIRYTADREANIRRAELCKDDIDLDLLQSWPMDPDPDIFFETLIGMIKNDLISYQAFTFKKEREQLHELKNTISRLKVTNNYANFDEIFSGLNHGQNYEI
jgi:hypothetical protein